MKKWILLSLAGIFCAQSFRAQPNVFSIADPVTKTHKKITVGVHPQIELISIVQTISQYPSRLGFLMARDSTTYKTEVLKHFLGYSQHPAVLLFNELSLRPRMLNFSAPSQIMLYTDENLNLRSDILTDSFVIGRAGGMDTLQLFLKLLKDFAVASAFNDFYANHKPYYESIIETSIANMGNRDYINALEDFYGMRQESYNIYLVSLYGFVGFGNSILLNNGLREISNTMGPQKVVEHTPWFGDHLYFQHMILHEFSHPFVNPLTEKYWETIKDFAHLYDSIPVAARKKVCGDWQECINEFTIRAITTWLAYLESEETGRWAYDKEKAKGVDNLDILLDKIEFYQKNRNRFPDFDSYYERLLEVFKKPGY